MPRASQTENVSPDEAWRLVRQGRVRPLDVRSPEEHQGLGHIPGSLLLPIDLIAAAPATIPREGPPLLVYCEHGVRSAAAARFLAQAGFPHVINMIGGMSRWSAERDHGPGEPFGPHGPCSWLILNANLIPPPGGRALDVACGRGRHALLLASAGLRVDAVDRDVEKINALAADAAQLGLPITARVADLEAPEGEPGHGPYDLIVVIHYLHRPLFPALRRALRPGGVLLYETFTVDQAPRGSPSNPDYLLRHGELEDLVSPLEVLRRRDGLFEGRCVASVAARRLAGQHPA